MGDIVRLAKGRCALLAATLMLGLITAIPADALQCVPYARVASGIDLRGDAWQWWNAAAGAYERGHKPRVGAVLVFRKHGRMRLGHVAVVRALVNSRTMMIDHANWGSRGAGRGDVAKMVPVRDVSPHNDWSQVKVWNAATQDFGTQSYPTYGFIYARGNTHPKFEPYIATLPNDVATFLSSGSTAQSPQNMDLALDVAVATEVQPVDAAPVAEVRSEALGVVLIHPVNAKGLWVDDRDAAVRANSSRH